MDNKNRVKNREILVDIIEEALNGNTNEELDEIMDGAKFPYGPVNKLSQVFQDPQVLHNGMVRKMVHESVGEIYQVIFIYFLTARFC